jgi:hypothetical protein
MKCLLTCLLQLLLGLILIWDCRLSMSAPDPKNNSKISPPQESSLQGSTYEGVISMRVLWTVSEYKIGKVAAWGEQEARALLFKPLDMDEASITFDGQTCRNITFKKELVDTKEYLRKMYHIDPQALGVVDKTVEVIRTNCSLPGFAEYMRLQDKRLIIHLNGVFFYFSPAVNY